MSTRTGFAASPGRPSWELRALAPSVRLYRCIWCRRGWSEWYRTAVHEDVCPARAVVLEQRRRTVERFARQRGERS